MAVLRVYIWSWQKCFSFEKNKQVSVGGGASACSKALQYGLSSCAAWPVKNIGPFSSFTRNTKCFHVLSALLKIQMSHVPMYGSDWLVGIIVSHGLDLCSKFRISSLIRAIRVMFLSYHTLLISIGLIQFFSKSSAMSSDWDPNTLRSSCWFFRQK